MSIKSHISLIDLSRQLPFEIDDTLKGDLCFGETLVISCGHHEGEVDDGSSESDWTGDDSTSTKSSEEVEPQKPCIVQSLIERDSKVEQEEEGEEENDFQFFFFPDCKKTPPTQHSQSSIVMVDGLPKINPIKTASVFCTCKKDKKGECECFTKLPCLCGAKLKADCTCRDLKYICTCDPAHPAPKCVCSKAEVCVCDPDGKITPGCICADVEKPCFCNIPNVFPSPICKCACKPKKVSDITSEYISPTHRSEGEGACREYGVDVKDENTNQPCDCQKPDLKKMCYCKIGKDCVCHVGCICDLQKTCETTENENIPCEEAESNSICNCDLPKDCVCGSQSKIICECFSPQICTCGDPEHCKCFAVCTCKKPCICDLVPTKEKVCTCFDTPAGLSDIVCTCPKPENKNPKRVRAGKHGYRWCREVDPYHTYFDYAYERHKKIEIKEPKPKKLIIQGLHDKYHQGECPVHGEEMPKYAKKIKKQFLDCCSAVGGAWDVAFTHNYYVVVISFNGNHFALLYSDPHFLHFPYYYII